MKIRTRLSLLFTFLTALLLLAFSGVIYFAAQKSREKEFYALLQKEAITKANLLFEAKIDAKTLQNIYKNNRKSLNEVEVAIYNTQFALLYHDAVEIDFVKETQEMLNEILGKKKIQFYQEKWQVIGLEYTFEGQKYLLTAAALDEYGYNKLQYLLQNIIFVFIISVIFIYVMGRYFAFKALEPVQEMTHKVKQITATNLDLRLPSSPNQDELSQLAQTFNEMLNRLESSFEAQKHFVSNISHELRTPLAAIITELELSLAKERNPETYQKAIANTLNDAKKLVRLSNSLLDLAKASYDATEIKFKPVRIDELLLDAFRQVQQANPTYKIEISFEDEVEFDEQISVSANEYLLKTAFTNLIENGCKFSKTQKSTIAISFDKSNVLLKFTDEGIGISQTDLEKVFTPFYRGENKTFAEGNGIGLFLTQKIVLMHKGNIQVFSQKNKGTCFLISIPHL